MYVDAGVYSQLLDRIYDTHRGQLEHEDNLINHRVSWLVTSQSFLLGTYVFLMNSPVVHLTGSGTIESSGITFDAEKFREAVDLLRLCFSIAGMVASVSVALSVWAALFALRDLVISHAAQVQRLDADASGLADDEKRRVRSFMPPIISLKSRRLFGCASCTILPALFASVWLSVFLYARGWSFGLGFGIGTFVILALLQIAVFSNVAPASTAVTRV